MQLSHTRYIKIDGTSVTANVSSAAEAKIAKKELRQKKREVLHIKRGLMREKKAVERLLNAERRKKSTGRGVLSGLRTALSTIAGLASGERPEKELPRLELECARTDELLHNLDSVLIQIEGKLLHRS